MIFLMNQMIKTVELRITIDTRVIFWVKMVDKTREMMVF